MPLYFMGGCVLLLFVGLFILFIVHTIENTKKQQIKALRERLAEHDREQLEVWSESEHVHDLIIIYAHMLKKHGKNSEEAKHFRFGVENKQLSKDQKALKAFNKISDILETAWTE